MSLTTFDYLADDDFHGVRSHSVYVGEKFVVYFGAATYGSFDEAHCAAEEFDREVAELIDTLPPKGLSRRRGWYKPVGRDYIRAGIFEKYKSFTFRHYGSKEEAEKEATKWREGMIKARYPNTGNEDQVKEILRQKVKQTKAAQERLRLRAREELERKI